MNFEEEVVHTHTHTDRYISSINKSFVCAVAVALISSHVNKKHTQTLFFISHSHIIHNYKVLYDVIDYRE